MSVKFYRIIFVAFHITVKKPSWGVPQPKKKYAIEASTLPNLWKFQLIWTLLTWVKRVENTKKLLKIAIYDCTDTFAPWEPYHTLLTYFSSRTNQLFALLKAIHQLSFLSYFGSWTQNVLKGFSDRANC